MSRKEEKKRIREEKRQSAQRRERMQNALVWGFVIVLVPLALYVFTSGLFGGAPVVPPDQVAASDHVRGPEDAPVTLTIYADFQCPACYTETRLIARAWPQMRDRVRLVFRHFPLDSHRHAFLAARYAEAAGLQGRFWEMHDLLFLNQQSWSGMNDASVRQAFNGYGLELSLDMQQLQQDLNTAQVRDKIIADQQGGVRAGVTGTPSIFLNGRIIRNPATITGFLQLVQQATSEPAA